MQTIKQITGKVAVLAIDNIDTDQIIPAEHLKITNKAGLGAHLFANWRYKKTGIKNVEFVLNDSKTRDACILVAGKNFACGSSREHAPWALLDYGFKVVISCQIADIFKSNALKNGLLPIEVNERDHQFLLAQNGQIMHVDIETQIIELAGKKIEFGMDSFSRYCFIQGMDQLDFLLNQSDKIVEFETRTSRNIV